MTLEEITDYDALWDAAQKCRNTVSWKTSVMHYDLNQVEEVLRLERELRDGTYKPRIPRTIKIYYPKKRDAMSIPYKDRILQRSINDLCLYPEMTRHFIYDNCACQIGKGTTFCRKRIRRHLWNYYCNHGVDGYVVQIDIHGYYPNMSHKAVRECFARYIDPEILKEVDKILKSQEVGSGYNPGSQMIQIAGIALLDPLDHYIKERLHVRHYVRYMDDFWMVLPTKVEAQRCLDCVVSKLKAEYGFDINPDKTHVRPLSDGFEMLGFRWQLSRTGRIVQNLLPQNVRHERNRLIRMASKGVSRQDAAVSLECWMAHAAEGQNAQSVRRMKQLFNTLYKEDSNAKTRKKQPVTEGGC